MSYSGQCLCGLVRFTIDGPMDDPHACHCGMCRRQSGHFVAAANADRKDTVIEGEEHVTWHQSSARARRGFCGTCGSVLFWDDGTDSIGINLGSLNQPTGLELKRHIFTEDKADYYDIADDLPRFIGSSQPAE